jgi:hypothetical protein
MFRLGKTLDGFEDASKLETFGQQRQGLQR